jgi:diguanylate cyclase (GGDEF)-like protein
VKIRTRFVIVAIVLSALVFVVLTAALYLSRQTADELARIGGTETALLNRITHGYGRATTDVYRYAVTAYPSTKVDLDEHLLLMREAQRELAAIEGGESDASEPGETAMDATLNEQVANRLGIFAGRADQVVSDRLKTGKLPILTLAAFSSASQNLEESLASLADLEAAKTTANARQMATELSLLERVVTLAGFAALIIAAVVAGILLRSITRPVRALKSAAVALAEGDAEYPVDEGRKDEFGDLNRAFVLMRSDLQDSMVSLQDEVGRRAEAQQRYKVVANDMTKVNADLEGEVAERERVQAELEHANQRLNVQLDDVAAVTQEMAILAEMAAMLQSDIEPSEAYAIIASYSGALLPGTSGALYTMAESRNLLDRTACWGEDPPSMEFFGPGDCWSLRLGRPHSPEDEHVFSECRHVDGDERGSYLCVPLTAQGDAVGVLVVYKVEATVREGEDRVAAMDRARRIALTFGEQVALAMSNLKLRESLREQSIRDPLTGLYNRRFMEDAVERETARSRRTLKPIGFVMLDIDRFKEYNDRAGHGAGDAVLAAVGAYLRDATRTEDVACRYGGEEFLLVFPGADAKTATARAEQIRQGIKALVVQMAERTLPSVTVSMGVSELDPSDDSADAALAAADKALYIAKNGGRDRVVMAADVAGAPEGVQGTTGYEEPEHQASSAA